MFAARLGGKFTEFPGLAKYVAMLKVSCTKVPCAHIGCVLMLMLMPQDIPALICYSQLV